MVAKTSSDVIFKAVELYQSGLCAREVSERLGISTSTVNRYVRQAGVGRCQSQAKLQQYALRPKKIEHAEPGKVYGKSSNGHKACAKCDRQFIASLEFFYKRTRSNGRSYLSSKCKECIKRERNIRFMENPNHVKNINRKSRDRNKEAINLRRRERMNSDLALKESARARSREYYYANAERLRAYRLAYMAENRDKVREGHRVYVKNNQDRYRAHRRNRKARLRGAEGKFTQNDTRKQFDDQGGKCFWCRCDIGDDCHADHFLPIAQGGSNKPYNIVLACPTCNLSRGKKLPSDFFSYLKWVARNKERISERREYLSKKMREHRMRMRDSRS